MRPILPGIWSTLSSCLDRLVKIGAGLVPCSPELCHSPEIVDQSGAYPFGFDFLGQQREALEPEDGFDAEERFDGPFS